MSLHDYNIRRFQVPSMRQATDQINPHTDIISHPKLVQHNIHQKGRSETILRCLDIVIPLKNGPNGASDDARRWFRGKGNCLQ